MKMTRWMIAPLALGLGAGPALAAGLDVPPPERPVVIQQTAPMMAGADWTGFYGGAQLGYGDTNIDTGDLVETLTDDQGSGPIGGVHVGYMWDFGTTVIGAELDYDAADIDIGSGDTIDDIGRLKFRAGYDAGQTLFYGTAGVAAADADIGGVSYSDQGWLAGAGLAYDLGNNWLLGGEILYHNIDDFDDTGLDVDVTTITARVSYRF